MTNASRRFLFYSPDTYGLGHLRRTVSLAQGVSKAFPAASILCVTGSPAPHSFKFPERMDCLKLPSVTKNGSGRYVPRDMNVPLERLLELRASILESCVRSYRPDLMLVDHTPLGVGGELGGILERLKDATPETRLVLGLRDVYDAPEATARKWRADGMERILETYDQVLVYGQRDVFDVGFEYGLSPRVAERLLYTGYVYSGASENGAACTKRPRSLGGSPFVVVTVGGGQDGFELVRRYLQGLAGRAGAGAPRWRSLVVTGPFMERVHRREVRSLASECAGVSVVSFTSRLQEFIGAADVVVTMGGYNSLVEVVARTRRAVVVPRVAPREEQLVRAARFEERGLVTTVDPTRATPSDLVRAVEEALLHPDPARWGDLDLEGVARSVEALAGILDVPPVVALGR